MSVTTRPACRLQTAFLLNRNYCLDSLEEMAELTLMQKIKKAINNPSCDRDLASSVMYDANVTRWMNSVWLEKQRAP